MPHIYTRKEVRQRRMRYQVAAGMFDFLAIIAGIVVIAVCVVLLTALFKKAVRSEPFRAALDGMKACVTGVILATGAYMILTGCFGSAQGFSADVPAVVLTAALAAVYFGARKVRKNGMSPIVLICLAGAAGVLVYGWK